MQTVLITGGRAPVALDFALKFKRRGWRVLVAESMPVHLCQHARAVDHNYTVPSPRFDADGFITALCNLIQDEGVTLLLPTCEEVFTIGQGYEHLAQYCTVFSEPLARLLPLHSKWDFIQLAQRYELLVPETELVDDAARYLGQSVVLKPEFSRFATATIITPKTQADIETIDNSQGRWVAQTFIAGKQICTYSIVHNGEITAHCAYATAYTAGQGATIAFEALDHPQSKIWVEKFVACYGFTGQIAFDFIETATGEIYAIECNPRAISGVHLFGDDLVDAICEHSMVAPLEKNVAVWLALLCYGWQSAPNIREWLVRLLNSSDVVFDLRDPLPFLAQFMMLWYVVRLSKRHNLNLIEATTYDIEWNQQVTTVETVKTVTTVHTI